MRPPTAKLLAHVTPSWSAERIPGGYVVKDANGLALAYVYARATRADADIAQGRGGP